MEPGAAGKCIGARIAKGEGSRPVREHGSLPVGLNDHNDAGAAAAALQEGFYAGTHQSCFKRLGGGVFADRANEACGAPSRHRCHGNVGGTPTAPSRDLGGGIRPSSPWLVQPHGDLVDEVAHTDDQWA
jgi:hypothetical protein